jgi:hypothetical protein
METLGFILAILIYLAIIACWVMLFLDNVLLSIIGTVVIGFYLGVKITIDTHNFHQWFKSNLK